MPTSRDMSTSSIGRVSAALSSVVNENLVTLANLNFDFTLFKVEAPREFSGLGTTMSARRKENAESGPQHRTARKLGALFDGVLPPVPGLLTTYGKRVSEIAQSEKVNPKMLKVENMFANHIGADSTSIWAAVTSGEGAVSVHLLACMLARAWTDSQATAIWVEMVDKRKGQVLQDFDTAAYSSKYNAAVLAAQQDFTRAELADWDNSARSWLQCGDLAMAKQHLNMTNVLDKANLPVNTDRSLYGNVMKAWVDALKATDNLVSGIPQKVQDGAILLALSAWHLYPDMYMLGASPPEIRQKDQLIGALGILTIGMESASKPDGIHSSVTWSLPLAYMSYYGDPQIVSQSIGHDNTKITMDQFAFILLGSVISNWEGFAKDTAEAVRWVAKIAKFLGSWEPSTAEPRAPNHIHGLLGKTSWIGQLLVAAEQYESNEDDVERSTAMKLVALGRRRRLFLHPAMTHPPPLFGLCNFKYLFSLITSTEERIECLRKFACRMGSPSDQFVIRYKQAYGDHSVYEYATVKPFGKASQEGSGIVKRSNMLRTKNVRWLSIQTKSSQEPCKCKGPCLPLAKDVSILRKFKGKSQPTCPCIESNNGCSMLCHDWTKMNHGRCNALHCGLIPQRLAAIGLLGEHCLPAHVVESISNPRNGKVDFGTGLDFDASLRELYKGES